MINSSSFLKGFYFELLLNGKLCVLGFYIELLRVSQKGINQRTFGVLHGTFLYSFIILITGVSSKVYIPVLCPGSRSMTLTRIKWLIKMNE